MTDFAAAFPLSRVEAARMQRTMTAEYMCQGCDWRRSFNGDAVLARLLQQVVEFAEHPHRKRADRFQEHSLCRSQVLLLVAMVLGLAIILN